jgi:hypothetical protein
MEDNNKIARIGFFTLHISSSLHFQHTKHTMFKILTSTNNYGHNRTTTNVRREHSYMCNFIIVFHV